MKSNLDISDQRILELIDILKQNDIIKFSQTFCDAVNVPKQLIRNIRIGNQHFTVHHIEAICKIYNVNANWIMGLEKNMFRKSGK